jgi:AcrR family transcriptional regulator
MSPKQTTRDRERTEQELIRAVATVLARDGFNGLGINAVARAAGMDKVLIYRYFGGLSELLQAYGASADFWPTAEEVLGNDDKALLARPIGERLSHVIRGLLRALQARPQTVEIMAWETVQQNALTSMLADVRERWAHDVIARVVPDVGPDDPDWTALANLLVAGFQYLLIRARTVSAYGGIDLSTDAGWQRIESAIRLACGDETAARSDRENQ